MDSCITCALRRTCYMYDLIMREGFDNDVSPMVIKCKEYISES